MKSSAFHSSHLITYFTIFALLGFNIIHGTVTQLPSHACQGEEITVECDLTVPDPTNNNFFNVIQFIVGTEDSPISDTAVNTGNTVTAGVNLSRLTAFANTSFSDSKNVLGSITLSSYEMSDAGILLGCSAAYFLNGNSGTSTTISETLRLTPAAPPSAPSIQSIPSSNIDHNTCSATISLNWTTPSSTDRTVDRYYLSLQNGTALDSIAAPANSYSYNTSLLLDTVYAYSVHASSCAGNSPPYTSYLNPIKSFSLQGTPQIDYNDVNQKITINWELSDESTPLLIGYSLEYRMNSQSRSIPITKFSALSSIRTRTQPLPRFKYNSIPSDAIIFIRITHQCGQTYNGVVLTKPPSILSPRIRIEILTGIIVGIVGCLILCCISVVIGVLGYCCIRKRYARLDDVTENIKGENPKEHVAAKKENPHEYVALESVNSDTITVY